MRPKNLAESSYHIFSRLLNESRKVEINGKKKSITTLEAVGRRIVANAAKGDKKSLNAILAVVGDKLISEAAIVAEKEQNAQKMVLEMSALVEKIKAKAKAREKAVEDEKRGKSDSDNENGSESE